jgi:Zn-dependent protease
VIDGGACPREPSTIIDLTGARRSSCAPGAARSNRSGCRRVSAIHFCASALVTITRHGCFPDTDHRRLRAARDFRDHAARAAHGYAARLLGDNTAYVMGRVSLNPMRHIDPVGTIAMPLAMYVLTGGAFLFGYAKPVPVSFGNLRNPRWGSLWVSLAGPACNFVQALLWGVLTVVLAPPASTSRSSRG